MARAALSTSRARVDENGAPKQAGFGESLVMYAGLGTIIWFGLDIMRVFAEKGSEAKHAVHKFRASGHEYDDVLRARKLEEREDRELRKNEREADAAAKAAMSEADAAAKAAAKAAPAKAAPAHRASERRVIDAEIIEDDEGPKTVMAKRTSAMPARFRARIHRP